LRASAPTIPMQVLSANMARGRNFRGRLLLTGLTALGKVPSATSTARTKRGGPTLLQMSARSWSPTCSFLLQRTCTSRTQQQGSHSATSRSLVHGPVCPIPPGARAYPSLHILVPHMCHITPRADLLCSMSHVRDIERYAYCTYARACVFAYLLRGHR
jgi:hypothetical protein